MPGLIWVVDGQPKNLLVLGNTCTELMPGQLSDVDGMIKGPASTCKYMK